MGAGEWHVCALDDEGVKCWGKNEYGQLNIPPGLKNVGSIAVGGGARVRAR